MRYLPRRLSRLVTIAIALVALGCAGTPSPRPETSARVKDSAPEKIAAQRAAVRGLDLERDDERWGIEAARERKRAQEQKKTNAPVPLPVPETGDKRVDVRQSPSDAPRP